MNQTNLTARDLATLAGISERRINQLRNDANAPLFAADGTITCALAGEWLRDYTMRKARLAGERDSSRLDRNEQGARKDAALADKTELANAARRAELIEASAVADGWDEIESQIRARMAKVPVTVAPLVVGSFDVHRVRETIDDFIRDALAELSAPADE